MKKQIPAYTYYAELFKDLRRPLAYIDLDILTQNLDAIKKRCQGTPIRIASKSIRCRYILDYLLAQEGIEGIMCYTAEEALWLSDLGYDNLLVAYPSYDEAQILGVCEAISKGKKIYLMADLTEHLIHYNKFAVQKNITLPICLDIDMTTHPLGIYFGVYRSALKTLADVQKLLPLLRTLQNIELVALMGYEAQIAGLADKQKGKPLFSFLIRLLKSNSIRKIRKFRGETVKLLRDNQVKLQIVNGGGTGSIESTIKEDVITEVTVGSGFYSPALFDHYHAFRHLPAAGFSLEVIRNPEPNIFTCLGGGYVASGTTTADKAPQPFLPKDCKLIKNEMAGEVQTPITTSYPLELGDSVLFRHSKAGELCEHFKELFIIKNGKIIDTVPTYRGEGKCFL